MYYKGEEMKEKVDVLLATYNGEKYVQEQIESILNQTYQNIHLIISDDGSKDNTREIIKEYEKKDERVTTYFQEKNLGYIKNFEFLMKQVESNYYMFSDQDDVWLPKKIEKAMQTLEEEKADLVFGDLEVVNQELQTVYPSFGDFMKLNRKIQKCKNGYEMNYLYNCVTGCTMLAKKETIEKCLPLPNHSKYVAHDHWIALVVSLEGKLAYIPEKYIKYRQHGNNEIGTDKISHKFKRMDQVRDLFLEVKLGVFGTYIEQKETFPKDIQEKNQKAYDYYERLTKIKRINLKGWGIFHTLYRNETIPYYLQNFMILNLPSLGRIAFQIRYVILKLMKKR